MNTVAQKNESAWVEYPSVYIKLLQRIADVLRTDKKLNKLATVNTIEGAIQEIEALQAHRANLINTKEADPDTELLCKAFMKGGVRWEVFKGYPSLLQEGELCINGLRYATSLKDGLPVLHEALRNALKRAIGYK